MLIEGAIWRPPGSPAPRYQIQVRVRGGWADYCRCENTIGAARRTLERLQRQPRNVKRGVEFRIFDTRKKDSRI